MPQLRHYDDLGTARFVTFSCYHRYQLLTDPIDIRIVLQSLRALTTDQRVKILGYVVMPEHVHLLLEPPQEFKLGQFLGGLKSRTARAILSRWRERGSRALIRTAGSDGRHRFWQARCYDHNCRTPETVIEKIAYCHKNPVTRRLVDAPEKWRWSSYRWYHGHDEAEIDIDGVQV